MDFASFANTRCINEDEIVSKHFITRMNRVARSASFVGYNAPFLAEQHIQER